MTDDTPPEKVVERIASRFGDDLQGADLYLDAWNPGDGDRWRLRLSPAGTTGVHDVGPAYKDVDELRAFLRGIEAARDLPRLAEPEDGHD